MAASAGKIIFLWDNLGPPHLDRIKKTAACLEDSHAVLGVGIFNESNEYDWVVSNNANLDLRILFKRRDEFSIFSFLKNFLLGLVLKERASHIFLCNYDRTYIFMAALLLKLLGRKVYTMMDSKFDDRPRTVWREVFKSFFFLPYSGVLTASDRSRDYAHFLGVAPKSIQIGYDTFDSSRLRSYCADPVNVAFQDRPFLIVARLIPKKNIEMALRAFAEAFAVNRSRRLVICGSGLLLDHLVKAAEALQISDLVEFKGFLQTDEICRLMSISLALVLPSTEEQFGQVVAEAQILSLPVMVSLACGARDELVRNAVNGFIFEPDNVEGLSRLMRMLSADEELWKIMSCNSKKMAQKADSGRFAAAIDSFVESERR